MSQKGTKTQTIFKLNFPDMAALKATWASDVKAGRFFVPTSEMLAPFSKVTLAFGVKGAPGSLEVEGEVVFLLEQAHCRPGQSPGLGLTIRLTDVERKAAEDYMAGRFEKAAESLSSFKTQSQSRKARRPTTPKPTPPKEDKAALSARIRADAEAFEMRAKGKTHYTVLDVAPDADKRAIRTGYSKLMRRFHPDNFYRRLDDETFSRLEGVYQRITEAYETLITPESRMAYDVEIRNFSTSTGGGSSHQKIQFMRRQKYSNINPKMVKMAESLYGEALKHIQSGDSPGASTKLKLALRYNPHMEEARHLLRELVAKEEEGE